MGFEDISIGIISDKATPKLLEAAVKGKVFKKVEIHGTATYGDAGEQTYLAIELENVQITSYQLGVLDNNAATDDLSMSLNFEKYTYAYFPRTTRRARRWAGRPWSGRLRRAADARGRQWRHLEVRVPRQDCRA